MSLPVGLKESIQDHFAKEDYDLFEELLLVSSVWNSSKSFLNFFFSIVCRFMENRLMISDGDYPSPSFEFRKSLLEML